MPVTWSDEQLILLYFPSRGSNSRSREHRSFKHGQGVLRPYPLAHMKWIGFFTAAETGLLVLESIADNNIARRL